MDPISLKKEIEELEKGGFKVKENLFIDKRVHIITNEHLSYDSEDTKIGTTKTEMVHILTNIKDLVKVILKTMKNFLMLILLIFMKNFTEKKKVKILFEGFKDLN